MFCESSSADLARVRETGHECSCCVTVAGVVSVTDDCAQMQGRAYRRRLHLSGQPEGWLSMTRCRHACRVRPGVSGEEHADPPRRRRRQMCMCILRANVPAMTAHERNLTQKKDGGTQWSPLSAPVLILRHSSPVSGHGRDVCAKDAHAHLVLTPLW